MNEPNLPAEHPSARRGDLLAVVYRRIDELKLDPANPRVHSRKQIGQIVRSIETFGFNVPVLVDGDDKVIAGHGRLLAARALGMTEVPTLCLEHLSPAQTRAFVIADNRLSEIASWDDRLLAEQLKDLSLAGLDFSLEVTGFEIGEIDLRIGALTDLPKETADPANAIPELASGPAVSKPGNLWVLGGHRVLCGNALDLAAFRELMGGERAAMVFADPPYNVPIDGHTTGLGAIHHRSFAMAAGEMSRPAFAVFLATCLRHLAGFSKAGTLLYICIDWRHIGELLAAGREADTRLENLCVWVKDKCRDGFALPQSARARIRVQDRARPASQQCPARPLWPQPQQCVALPRGQLVFPQNRGRQPLSPASNGQTGCAGRRCDPRLHPAGRHRARRLSRQWHDVDCRRAQRPAVLWAGTRSPLCRHDHPPLAGIDRRHRPSRRDRLQL